MDLDRFCNFIWFWATRNADEEARDKFERRLWQPPRGEVGRGVWSAENEANSFSSLKASLGL